jgi:hypothetical protein
MALTYHHTLSSSGLPNRGSRPTFGRGSFLDSLPLDCHSDAASAVVTLDHCGRANTADPIPSTMVLALSLIRDSAQRLLIISLCDQRDFYCNRKMQLDLL